MIEENFDVEYEIERQEYEEQLQEKHLKSLPEFLFKYKALNTEESIKRTVDILQDHRIFMPNYEQLNDPLEGANARLLGIDQTVRDEIRKKWQILALSSDCFLPTLWAYYADNYTGVCIGFKTHDTFDDIVKVDYVDGHKTWTSDLNGIEDDFKCKHKCWSFEKEWRIIRKAVFNDKGNVENQYLDFKENDIQHVFFFYKMKNEVLERIRNASPKSAQLWTVKPSTESYNLCAFNANDNRVIYSTSQLLE